MHSTLFSLTIVVAIFCAAHVAHAQYTVRIQSSFRTVAFRTYAPLFCFPHPVLLGGSIDRRDLYPRFRLGQRPATAITLPCRRLCSGCLHCQEYVFSRPYQPFISTASLATLRACHSWLFVQSLRFEFFKGSQS